MNQQEIIGTIGTIASGLFASVTLIIREIRRSAKDRREQERSIAAEQRRLQKEAIVAQHEILEAIRVGNSRVIDAVEHAATAKIDAIHGVVDELRELHKDIAKERK